MKRFYGNSVTGILKSSFQRNFSLLYKAMHRVYWGTRHLEATLLGTRMEERFWARRHREEIRKSRLILRGQDHPQELFF